MTDFSGVFWLGGSPCSGKSSVAQRLKAKGGGVYAVDAFEEEHLERARPEAEPEMCAWKAMDADGIWLRPVAEQVRSELAFYRERFPMILDDIATRSRPLLVEGAALLPELLADIGVGRRQAFFMVPTWTFQMEHYSRRPWVAGVLRGSSAPEQAFDRWMRRDHAFGNAVAVGAASLGWPLLRVDGGVGLALMERAVADHFALGAG